jgi:hypothetical protein
MLLNTLRMKDGDDGNKACVAKDDDKAFIIPRNVQKDTLVRLVLNYFKICRPS